MSPDLDPPDPEPEPQSLPQSFAIGTTGMGIPDEALCEGETLEDELVSDEGEAGLTFFRPPSP